MTTQKKSLTPVFLRGFTLIEVLVVIVLLAVLVAIVVLILNPAEYLRRARDAQRLGDAARISTAMALYNFGTASRPKDQDPDGPRYPTSTIPVIIHDSCIGDPVPHRLFVSVPSDNGESSPTPPTDWVYVRVSSSQLRAIDGDGWFPVDFTSAQSGQVPFSVMPVDPVNSFASGYYYSYGCGSWNLQMHFESQKFRTENAGTDQGRFNDIYEIGSDLNVLPDQPSYNPDPASMPTPEVASGNFVLRPYSKDVNSNDWGESGGTGATILSDNSTSTYIFSVNNNTLSSYTFNGTIPQFNTVDSIELVYTAAVSPGQQATVLPFVSFNGVKYPNDNKIIISTTMLPQNPIIITDSSLLSQLTPANIANLHVGIKMITKAMSALTSVGDFSVKINYH